MILYNCQDLGRCGPFSLHFLLLPPDSASTVLALWLFLEGCRCSRHAPAFRASVTAVPSSRMPFPRQLYGSLPPFLRIFTHISPCWWGWLAVVFLSKISVCPLQYLSAFPLFFFLPTPYTGSFAYYYIKFFFSPTDLKFHEGRNLCLSRFLPYSA